MDSTSRALNIPHVLVCIFKHLPAARDIINSRGVCKLWNQYCDPKFVFRKFDLQPQEIDILLRNTNCRRLNLEFQDYDMKYFSNEMWQTWSPKLRSLRIYRCFTPIASLQFIISNCVGLEVLEIVPKPLYHRKLLEEILDIFIEREERHTRLRRLSINGQIFTKMSQFSKLLTVFPCIEDLHCGVERAGADAEFVCFDSNGTYDMRKFKRNNDLGSERKVPPMLDYQLFRLTTYKTKLEFYYISKNVEIRERLFHFFTIQKDLEVIDLQIHRYNFNDGTSDDDLSIFIKSLVFHVLRTCQKLREFRLLQDPIPDEFVSVKLTSEESVQFFSLISNLQCFKIPFILKTDTSETTVSLPSLSLSVLQLNTKEPYFFSKSPRLKHLDIDVYSDQQLREIIISMPNLEILTLRLHCCTTYGFAGENEESSIRRLQKLKYLHIIDCKGTITKEVFDEFHFPHLEYLGLCLEHVDNLPETLVNMPAIRTLEVYPVFPMDDEFYWMPMPEVIAELCKTLRNLKHLIVDDLADYVELCNERTIEIFNSLSNLKFITCCRADELFIFDRRSRKASSSERCNVQFSEDKFYGRWDRHYDCSKFRCSHVDWLRS